MSELTNKLVGNVAVWEWIKMLCYQGGLLGGDVLCFASCFPVLVLLFNTSTIVG